MWLFEGLHWPSLGLFSSRMYFAVYISTSSQTPFSFAKQKPTADWNILLFYWYENCVHNEVAIQRRTSLWETTCRGGENPQEVPGSCPSKHYYRFFVLCVTVCVCKLDVNSLQRLRTSQLKLNNNIVYCAHVLIQLYQSFTCYVGLCICSWLNTICLETSNNKRSETGKVFETIMSFSLRF